ncbi:MAG: O-antigen ligase family protein [Deltaproteobacteria bacterium]|nr:O-antigen ligase family protein [Deltaproteobacteria bacterium]
MNFSQQKLKLLFSLESFNKNVHYLLYLYCFIAAISIALTQIILAVAILYWYIVLYIYRGNTGLNCNTDQVKTYFIFPLALWLLANLISSLFGVAITRSLKEVISSAIYLCLPIMMYWLAKNSPASASEFFNRIKQYLFAFIVGQSFVGIHSLYSGPEEVKSLIGFPGPVTESGQLVLIITVLFALLLEGKDSFDKSLSEHCRLTTYLPLFAVYFILFLLMAWPDVILPVGSDYYLPVRLLSSIIVILATPTLINYSFIFPRLSGFYRSQSADYGRIIVAFALLLVVFIVNLKRGPWLGVIVALSMLSLISGKKLCLISIILFSLFCSFLTPVHNRLSALSEHFTIAGGRKQMWEMGYDLIQLYPFGVGPDNARYMRQIDPSLPDLHRHMHNNLLNIAVETGWLGSISYIWWLLAIGFLSYLTWKNFKSSPSPLAKQGMMLTAAIFFALVGWQVAGLVEYNFGDGEIRTMAFFFMGLLLVLNTLPKKLEQNS